MFFCRSFCLHISDLYVLQIPDVRTGDDVIDAVVVDEESVGIEGRGRGGKILYGKGAFDRHFPQNRSKDSEVSLTWHDLVFDVANTVSNYSIQCFSCCITTDKCGGV